MENIENKELLVNLKNGKYFNYGDRYFVTFNYGSEEQQRKMYELFENGLLNSYGSHSQRADEGKDYIMPYFVNEFGQVTPQDTGKIGGTSIPEDLLPEFIRRFIEVDKAVVNIGEQKISEKFDYNQFDKMVQKLRLQIDLQKGEYFNYGDRYFVTFNYGSEEQQRKMYELFENGLLNSYGSHSQRADEGKDYIMPYFVNEFGQVTPQDTGKIGGTSIPEDLLPEFIRRFIEVDKAVVNIGEQKISEKFDYNQFNRFVESMGSNKHI